MTLKFVLYANQKSCLIVIPSARDVNHTLDCYRGGALRDQLNNSFERDQDNSDDFFLIKRCGDSKNTWSSAFIEYRWTCYYKYSILLLKVFLILSKLYHFTFTCYTCPLVFNTSKTSELQKAQNLKMSNVNFAQKRKIYWHYGEEAVVGIYFPVSNLKEWDSFPKKVIIKKIPALV